MPKKHPSLMESMAHKVDHNDTQILIYRSKMVQRRKKDTQRHKNSC